MYQINSNFSISRLNNAEITAFYINLQKAITENDVAQLGIDGVMPAFGQKLRELIDRVYVTTGSEYTAALKAADDRRCLIFRRIRLRLQMVEVADDNEGLLACQDAVRTHLLTKYVSTVTSKAYQERTSILQGFIMDLRSKLSEEDISALSLGGDIVLLEQANAQFISLYAQRTAERAEGNNGITARLREEMYDFYLRIIFSVQYLANSTDEANAEKAAACQSFIAVVNVLLADAKRRLEQRLANSDSNGEGGTSDEAGDGGADSGAGGAGDGAMDGSNQNTGTGGGTGTSGTNTGTGTGGGGTNTGTGGTNTGTGGGADNGTDASKPSGGGVVSGDGVSF